MTSWKPRFAAAWKFEANDMNVSLLRNFAGKPRGHWQLPFILLGGSFDQESIITFPTQHT
jgi:hypothetical protein